MGEWQSSMEGMVMSTDFWRGKRVFLTGHTGFKGSWLSLWLQSLGAEITGFALNPPTILNLFDTAKVARGMTSIIGDIRQLESLQAAIHQAQPEIVFHLAAQALVRYSYENPVETYATNVMGTVHLLEAVRHCASVKAVVIVTSDKCYENREWVWGYRENEAMGGHDPYSSSKGCAELVTAAYRSSYMRQTATDTHGIYLASARAGNVIGGGDWAEDRLVPDIIRAIAANQKVTLRNPMATRPWQHVLEPLNGYMTLAQKLYEEGDQFADAWNFGPTDHDVKTVEWMTKSLVRHWGEGASYQIAEIATGPHEANLLKLDCAKANTKLGWLSKWDATEAIKRICDWHKAHRHGEDMRAYCLHEIRQYQH